MYFEIFYDEMNQVDYLLNESVLQIQSVRPYRIFTESTQVLNEAAITKESLRNTLIRIKDAILRLLKRFTSVLDTVRKGNSEWLEKVKNFNIREAKPTKTEYELYPYWKGFRILKSIKIPRFNEADVELLSGDGSEYIKKYFSQISDNDGSLAPAKNILRGNNEKQRMTMNQIVSNWTGIVNILVNYELVGRDIARSDNEIIKVVDDAITRTANMTMNETAILESSIYDEEDIIFDLLEAVITPDSVEDDGEDDTKPNNAQSARGGGKTNDTTLIMAMKQYVKICYGVNAIRKDVLEEMYTEFAKLVDSIMTKGKKKTEPVGEQSK